MTIWEKMDFWKIYKYRLMGYSSYQSFASLKFNNQSISYAHIPASSQLDVLWHKQ